MLKARDIMKREVITVLPEDPIKKVIKELVDNNISSVAVKGADGNLVGMVSEYDLILAMSTVGHGLDVAHIMKKEFISIKEETSIEEIADIFLTKRIKALPVVDEKNKLIGILSRRDILEELYAKA